MFRFFDFKARGILAPQQEIKPILPALKGEVSTTGPPGKSWESLLLMFFFFYCFLLHCMACGIFIPQPGIEFMPPAVEM